MKFILLFLSLFSYRYSYALDTVSAKVVGVKDGDTYVILIDKTQITIRLEHVDCPEKKQAYGQVAKQFGSNFCFGKIVKVLWKGTKDRNGRWIAEIYLLDKCLNKELVKNGLAWHFKKYSKSLEYSNLELEARKNKMGLWKDINQIAPWEWRKK
ncbi:MAG: thermonuclease family protein [Chitinophagales bacterium]|jgi:micrococcal nuclease|nr:thermonuclease family protein [Sphingobacteriales bacterium]